MNVCAAPVPVVFDLDGTLIDSAPDIHAAVNAVLEEHGRPTLSLERVRSFIGGGVQVLWDKIGAELGIAAADLPPMVAAFMTRYQGANDLTILFDGVREALELLSSRGHPLGLCTNKPAAITAAVLDHFGLSGLFGAVISGDSLPQKKPDPAPLLAVLTALGSHPDQPRGLYVGDSDYDAACAQRAGVPLMLYTGGYCHAAHADLPHHAQFDHFSALPGLVERAAATV